MASNPLHPLIRAIEEASTQSGESLVDLSQASPVLLVFLRHARCPFCREALGDIARHRRSIEADGTRIVLVHMGDSAAIRKILHRYGLPDLDRISDPERRLYQAFGLPRGKFSQVFGPKVFWRAIFGGALARHGIGFPSADSAQMPGLFLLDGSGILRRFRHQTAADRPDYAALCAAPVKCAEAS